MNCFLNFFKEWCFIGRIFKKVIAFVLCITVVTSCGDGKNLAKLVCDNLYSSYSLCGAYCIEASGRRIEGELELLRSDITKINFLSPDEYSSISVSSDYSGKSDIISFEFSGIPADVPKSIATGLSLMLSLFSDSIPSAVSALDKEAFSVNDNNGKATVQFSQNGIDYSLGFSSETGIPDSLSADDGKNAITINVKEFEKNTTE